MGGRCAHMSGQCTYNKVNKDICFTCITFSIRSCVDASMMKADTSSLAVGYNLGMIHFLTNGLVNWGKDNGIDVKFEKTKKIQSIDHTPPNNIV